MSTRHARSFALAVLALALSAAGCSRTEPSAASSSAVAAASTLLVHQEGETMTSGGGCVTRTNPYANLQCRSDAIYGTFDFPEAARYRFVVRGASSSSSRARAGLYVGGVRAAGLEWPGTAFTDVELTWDVSAPGAKEVRFVMEVDDGTSDTYIDWFELYSEGPIPPPPEPPPPPPESAYASGVYRNLFQEWNPSITDAQVQAKLDEWWASLFASTDDNKRVYYPFGTNTNGALAYIKDVGDNDIRSEGVSYGMMIAVQMNKQAEFNALWNFARSVMQHQTGPRKGYFAWQVSTSGSIMDQNPASDGEEYFATALFFAAHRWGNGTGIYNYTAEANAILDTMLHKEDMNAGVLEGVTSMFNRTQKQVVFVPYYTSANFTDPSYHLPAFYELWARWAAGWNGQAAADRQFWLDAAAASRAFFPKAAHATTGLSPDYAEFTGAPNNTNNHGDFRFDAWRVAMNWAVDYSWFRQDATEPVLADRLQAFLYGQGITSYGNQFTLAGSPLSSDHSPGLVACTGVASLAATNARRLEFVRELWNLNPPTGQWRYYDGMLSFMSLLHASGNFKIWKPGGSQGPYTLTVAKAGTGTGTVTSSPAGVSCGSTCSASFSSGTVVTLSAAAASGSSFTGWSGACSGTAATCSVTMSQARSVTATFGIPDTSYPLTVTRDGTGSGMVGSSPAGVDCGTTCTGTFAGGTSVTLLAVPAIDSLFTGWSGACSGTAACVVSMTAARSVTATFDRGSIYTLGVTRSGTGTGTVTSSPAGISCGTTCSASYVGGTVVTLTAAASSGSTFGGWTGCTTTSGATCTVSMTASGTVTATFNSSGYLLTVTRAGTGTGTVTSTPSGINCGSTCSATYTSGTRVTLRRTVASGSTFGGWSGACSGTTSTCVVTMSQARAVTATFNGGTPSYTLTVTRAGTGAGTVTSSTGGINCGSTCSASYTSGTVVTLTAAAATGSVFAGWSNACSGTTTTCVVTMSQARAATATFNANPILYALSVTPSGTGSGTVTSSPAGVSCGTTCSALFGSASVVTLTATPASGSVFSGWSGACSGAAATCTVTMTGAQSVTASFTPSPTDAVLTVTTGGTGSGTVTSSPVGLSCGTTCSAPFPVGTTVTLTAAATSPSTFGGWGGACSGTATTCVVSMSAAQTVTATFNGDGGTTPCANPITFSWNTGNFGTTGAVCYRASQTIYGWNCSNMAGRTVSINGGAASATCGGGALAKHTDGYTYFSVSAGQYAWASISVW